MSSTVATGDLDKNTQPPPSPPPLSSSSAATAPEAPQELPRTKQAEQQAEGTRPEAAGAEQDPDEKSLRHREEAASERARRRSERLLKKTHLNPRLRHEESSRDSHRSRRMLSKIKSAEAVSSVARRTRASSFSSHLQKQQQQKQPAGEATSDTEDEPAEQQQQQDNDSNNNKLEASPEHEKSQADGGGKKSQEELMEIVDSSRKRRLSKGSADSLSSFIRWSFGHLDAQQRSGADQKREAHSPHSHSHHNPARHHTRRGSFSTFTKQNTLVIENNNNMKSLDLELLNDQQAREDWESLSRRYGGGNNNNNNNTSYHDNNNHLHSHQLNSKLSAAEKLLRHAKLSSAGASSAANLAILRHQQSQLALHQQQQQQDGGSAGMRFKRQRTHLYSPDAKPFASSLGPAPSANRKVSSYLGNVVERLHQQNQREQPSRGAPVDADLAAERDELEADQQAESNPGLSYHLQQFLSQQTSLEDLCSSVGLDDSNQLVLAAAIHRALVDSVGPSAAAAMTGGAGGSGGAGGPANNADSKSTASSTGGSSSAGSSHHHQTTLGNRRAYNTRGAGGDRTTTGGASALQAAVARHQSSSAANSTAATLAALNINSRVQQQRHAQAAAALSALASAGSQQQQHGHHHHQMVHSSGLSTLASVASGGGGGGGSSQLTGTSSGGGQVASTTGNPMVDFECDTCGSSFDDRHRLMQHQSIHLELKKDWFNETPVDEVMKIFNRRRGEFLCNTCNLRFEATFDYDKHNHQVHGQRPYCCQFCGNGTRTFRFWRQYLNHLYDHRYIFSCTIDDCDFTVNRRDSLRFHIFRFHLNCQLPQQQTHIRSAGHHNMLLNDSKWPLAGLDEPRLGHHHSHHHDDDDRDDDQDDEDDPMMSIGD